MSCAGLVQALANWFGLPGVQFVLPVVAAEEDFDGGGQWDGEEGAEDATDDERPEED